MPSINDIMEIAQELRTKPVLVLAEKCAAVRNRNSSCTRCIDACPADAIRVGRNKLRLDFDACVGCQACCTACPTGALMPLDPMDADLSAQVAEGVAGADGAAVIACARIASKHLADPHTFAEVPCLCRVDEGFLLAVAARGVDDLVLVDGGCRTCKHRATRAVTDAVVDGCNALLAAWGAAARVRRSDTFPEACTAGDLSRLRGEDRRAFFAGAQQTAKQAAIVTATQQLHLKEEEKAQSLRDMLRISDDTGTLPLFEPQRQMGVMDALDRLGAPADDAPALRTRLWGRVEIDTAKCKACGMCTMFCPTGAISKLPDDEAVAAGCDVLLEYWNAACTQCRLCEDSCFHKALTLGEEVRPAELVDFEPRSFALRKPAARKGALFGANSRTR